MTINNIELHIWGRFSQADSRSEDQGMSEARD